MKRPAFDRLQKAIFAGTVTTVVVWKLDRISRGQRDGVNLLADWCERGVRVVAVTQQIDLSGAVGRMVASVLFGLAEIESEYRRERQAAGIAEAKERGVYRGRRARHDQGTTASCPGTPWPRSHGAGDRHGLGRQPADSVPILGREIERLNILFNINELCEPCPAVRLSGSRPGWLFTTWTITPIASSVTPMSRRYGIGRLERVRWSSTR